MSDITARTFNYGTFSARYGNIYTSRQLLQLFDRAFAKFDPAEPEWLDENGAFLDPFRPTIQPNGFSCLEELKADREQHLAAVREMFLNLDYFVFTLGLTECWVSSADGAAFPVCPGVSGGKFDPDRYRFVNLRLGEVLADMNEFISRLRTVNPSAKIILTVSPVPLMATVEERHVLVSTVASKAILRVACDEISRTYEHVAYFPSFEIITGTFNRGDYFGDDLRSVTETGVSHVMRLFLKHATDERSLAQVATKPQEANSKTFFERTAEIAEVICDEDALR